MSDGVKGNNYSDFINWHNKLSSQEGTIEGLNTDLQRKYENFWLEYAKSNIPNKEIIFTDFSSLSSEQKNELYEVYSAMLSARSEYENSVKTYENMDKNFSYTKKALGEGFMEEKKNEEIGKYFVDDGDGGKKIPVRTTEAQEFDKDGDNYINASELGAFIINSTDNIVATDDTNIQYNKKLYANEPTAVSTGNSELDTLRAAYDKIVAANKDEDKNTLNSQEYMTQGLISTGYNPDDVKSFTEIIKDYSDFDIESALEYFDKMQGNLTNDELLEYEAIKLLKEFRQIASLGYNDDLIDIKEMQQYIKNHDTLSDNPDNQAQYRQFEEFENNVLIENHENQNINKDTAVDLLNKTADDFKWEGGQIQSQYYQDFFSKNGIDISDYELIDGEKLAQGDVPYYRSSDGKSFLKAITRIDSNGSKELMLVHTTIDENGSANTKLMKTN